MILSIPLAVLAAICVSQFLHPSIRNVVKPVIEVMAALPSVVLGFLAGLWLAPLLEKIFVAILVMPFIVIALTLAVLFLWHRFPFRLSGRFRVGAELFTLVGVIGIAAALSLWLNGPLESIVFAGDFRDWFFRMFDLRYDQRNMLVVGFAMGFTVIPIIFTISEDALSSVPRTLSRGFPGPRGQQVADGHQNSSALGERGHILGRHDRFRKGRGRDDDRAHGHGQHPGDGLELL